MTQFRHQLIEHIEIQLRESPVLDSAQARFSSLLWSLYVWNADRSWSSSRAVAMFWQAVGKRTIRRVTNFFCCNSHQHYRRPFAWFMCRSCPLRSENVWLVCSPRHPTSLTICNLHKLFYHWKLPDYCFDYKNPCKFQKRITKQRSVGLESGGGKVCWAEDGDIVALEPSCPRTLAFLFGLETIEQ